MAGKKLLPHEVKYLAFEGGGFKGIAYVGAIKAMEDLGILDPPGPPPGSIQGSVPQVDPRERNKKILGFSGTSIGAFVSFLLTLGHDSETIRDTFVPPSGKPGLVERVFEKKAQRNIFRSVDRNVYKEIYSNQVDPGYILHKTNAQIAKQDSLTSNLPLSLLTDSTLFNAAVLGVPLLYSLIKSIDYKGLTKGGDLDFDFTNSPYGFAKDVANSMVAEVGTLELINILLKSFLKGKLAGVLASQSQNADQEFIDIITGDEFDSFFYNILFDCGAFTGTGLRKMVQDIFKEYLNKSFQRNLKELCAIDSTFKDLKDKLFRAGSLQEEERIWETITSRVNFRQLYALTGKQLSVVGANLSTKASLYFDHLRTPDFPVIDAVTISMNFPIVFKPVVLTNQKPDNMYDTELNGYWTDGGLLNNAPIHAFDEKDSTKVNDGVLCLRLTPGEPKFEDISSSAVTKLLDAFSRFIKQLKKEDSTFTITDFVADMLISSASAPAEEGQFRIPQEAAQSFELFSFSVQNFTIKPEKEVMDIIIKWSQFFAYKYFDSNLKAAKSLMDLSKGIGKLQPAEKQKQPKSVNTVL